MVNNQFEIEWVGPPWRDLRRNSASADLNDVQNSWMATQLVTKGVIWGPLRFRARLADQAQGGPKA